MTALTAPRNTSTRLGNKVADPVAAATTIYAGSIVCLDASGNAVPGSTATTLKARGVAVQSVDNSAGVAGDLTIESLRDAAHFANSSGADEVLRTHIGSNAYIVDDQTVAATDGTSTRSVAGKIIDVDAAGVWIEFH
jgi:hypothetical protein